MHGDSQRLRPNGSSPTSSGEVVEGAGRSSIPKGASPPGLNHRPYPQTSTVPSSWKDVLKSAIWHLLPPDYPGLSATEVHDRLKKQGHELLEHQLNLKSSQSAIYTALNEMMFVYVEKRRLKGARNHHQYIALQRTQGAKTQGKERINVPKSPAPMKDNVLHAQRSTSLEPQETKRSPGCRLVETQTAPERTAAPPSPPDGLSKTQTVLAAETCQDHKSQGSDMSPASNEQAQLQSSTEETRNNVVETQSQSLAVSSNEEHNDKKQTSTPAIAPSTNTNTRSEITDTMRHHITSGNCVVETPSNALVVRSPTVLLSSNGLSQKTKTPASPLSARSQGEQPRAGCPVMQQAPNRNPLVTKSSKIMETLYQDTSKTSEGCEAPSRIQGESLGRVTASPLPNVVPTQQRNTSKDGRRVDKDHTAQLPCREQTENNDDVENSVLIELGKKVKRAHDLRIQCETCKREKMDLQARSPAKQAALSESINRANEDIAHFNELNSRQQDLQAQLSDSERKLADARRQTILSRDFARRKDMEYQAHAALMAQLTDDHASADKDYQNELRSLGLG